MKLFLGVIALWEGIEVIAIAVSAVLILGVIVVSVVQFCIPSVRRRWREEHYRKVAASRPGKYGAKRYGSGTSQRYNNRCRRRHTALACGGFARLSMLQAAVGAVDPGRRTKRWCHFGT